MLTAGTLTEVVKLQKITYVQNTLGEQELTYTDIATVRANVKFSKGSRALDAGEMWNPTTIVVTIRYSASFLKAARVIWENRPYTVISNNGDRVNGSMTITCDLHNEGTGANG